MFQLNEKVISDISLDHLDIINIVYYKSKTDYLDIYDTSFTYDSNIPVLVTSYLNTAPKIIKGEKITTLDGEAFLTADKTATSTKSNFPSFFYDIENIRNTLFIYRRHLQKTLDYTNSKNLARFYKLDKVVNNRFTYYDCFQVLNRIEVTVMIWEWECLRFVITVNRCSGEMQLEVNINITEKKTLISSKVEFVNEKLQMIGKIISHITNSSNEKVEVEIENE